MNIVLNTFRQTQYPNLGALYLAAVLRNADKNNHVVATATTDVDTIMGNKPDVVALSFVSADFTKAKQIALALRRQGVPVIAGGAHLTGSPETLPSYINVGLAGEGEGIINQIVASQTLGEISDVISLPGIIHQNNNTVV